MKLPYHECPSFNVCSSNVCPLDPFADEKDRLKSDEKCRAHKSTRFRIGSGYPELLKYQGLTKKEWQGKKRWEALSMAEKEKIVERLSKMRKSQARWQGK